MILSGTNQDALQALFRDAATGCFGKRVLLEPTPMRVAGRGLLAAPRARHVATGVITAQGPAGG